MRAARCARPLRKSSQRLGVFTLQGTFARMRSSSWARNDGLSYAVHPQRPGVGCRQGRLRSVGHLIETYGRALLFLVVTLEAAGVPVPGETALIAASALASQGYFDIVSVIAVAAAAAIVGDNVGYWIGRMGGRSLLSHSPFIARYTDACVGMAIRAAYRRCEYAWPAQRLF